MKFVVRSFFDIKKEDIEKNSHEGIYTLTKVETLCIF